MTLSVMLVAAPGWVEKLPLTAAFPLMVWGPCPDAWIVAV